MEVSQVVFSDPSADLLGAEVSGIYICVYLYRPYAHRYMMHMSYVYTYMISKYFALHIHSEHTLAINAYLNTHVSICGAYSDKLFKYVYIYMYLFTICYDTT